MLVNMTNMECVGLFTTFFGLFCFVFVLGNIGEFPLAFPSGRYVGE